MIEVVFLDVDGVLTDGTVSVDAAGREIKRISFEDIDAVFELKRSGIKIGFLTGEDNPFCQYVRDRFAPDYFLAGCKDKLGAFKQLVAQEGLDPAKVCYTGDSGKDIDLLRYLSCSFVPADVAPYVKGSAKTILKAHRGRGVVKEVADQVLRLNAWKNVTTGKEDTAYWSQRVDEHLEVIQQLQRDPVLLSQLNVVAARMTDAFRSGCQLLLCGNGGSAADSQHIAGELVSRFFLERPGLNAEALTSNVASMTAIGNDYAYEKLFARQVEAKGRPGDILIGMSTSGSSKNVNLAMKTAQSMGMMTVGLTGIRKDTDIVKVSDYCIHVPSKSTPRIQEAHLLIGHMLCEFIEQQLFGG